MARKHWIAGSGEYGCLYDQCGSYGSKASAIESMAQLFDGVRGVKAQLRRYEYMDLPAGAGADYVEITVCTCDTPEVHNDYWQRPTCSGGASRSKQGS